MPINQIMYIKQGAVCMTPCPHGRTGTEASSEDQSVAKVGSRYCTSRCGHCVRNRITKPNDQGARKGKLGCSYPQPASDYMKFLLSFNDIASICTHSVFNGVDRPRACSILRRERIPFSATAWMETTCNQTACPLLKQWKDQQC